MKHISSVLGASIVFTGLVGGGVFSPSASAQTAMKDYLVIAASTELPASLPSDVAAAGGVMSEEFVPIGVAVASSADPGFAARLEKAPGVRSVVEDVTLQMLEPEETMMLEDADAEAMASATGERYYSLLWGLHAVGAAQAWDAGLRGAGVRVAVLDSGIDASHPDIAPNLNTALSASFVAGEGYAVHPGRYFNHGTHVAATIAGAQNGVGVVGVAPDAEIVAVKVLSEYTGSGSSSGVIAGILYAADIDADIINMSLGSYFTRHIYGNGAAEYAVAYSRAIAYAYQQGTTVIVSAGNSAADRDMDADGLKMPADAPHALAIAATAPTGWYYNRSGDLDGHASYSDYGRSAISFAAPGGDFRTYPAANWHYDMVLSASPGGWFFSAGTSMAAPHASGVAALIIGANGGSMDPAHVEAALRASADDLGQPGQDPYYGHGRVSAANLVP